MSNLILVSDELLLRLAQAGTTLELREEWPAEQLQWLAGEGVMGWTIPREFGGFDVSNSELLRGYEALAASCLVTTLILTQRNAACQRLAISENARLKERLLPDLAAGKTFATVGISHLTTSRQHQRVPAVTVDFSGNRMTLKGTIPWVTGAAHADYLVTGGTCDDGQQILVAVPTKLEGVQIAAPIQLMALGASKTTSVELHNVTLSRDWLIAGPVDGIMKQGGGGAGSVSTSTLALGLAARALDLIEEEAEHRPEIASVAEQFANELLEIRTDLYRSIDAPADLPSVSAAAIRQRANSLVLRLTQAGVAISKGAGYVRGHPAELAVRQAMFFLVWSCPQPVVQGVLEELACF
ncbi:acyl-CoA dehydrogenase family protein [Planctomicrobium sp. SH664]|uniref:acyl-CoA dehydrogenase family protein n=1 Tax=Planctomicrobium sp. SH664 TaxID=3448125 RepID=UPI003F5C22DE